MSHLFQNYSRDAIEIMTGQGTFVKDQFGKSYLDFTSGIGVVNLGYGHPKIQQAVDQQMQKIWHMPNLYQNSLQEEVAGKLSLDETYVSYFCNSGAEANEAAIKLARKYTQKSKIVSFDNSFHGRTYAAMSATGQKKIHHGFEPLVPDFHYLPYNDFPALEKLDEKTAAVMVELIQGEGGVVPADKKWALALQKKCQEKNILLIIDEIQTGMGRTGYLYSFEAYGLNPDIFTLAKGLGNGLPVGAMLVKKELAGAFGPGSHGSTFGGNKVVMAAASAVLDELKKPGFLEGVQAKSVVLKNELEKKVLPLNEVAVVRGLGLMIGIEVRGDVAEKMKKMQNKGLLVLRAGQQVIRLLPPLTLSEQEIQQGVAIISEALQEEEEQL